MVGLVILKFSIISLIANSLYLIASDDEIVLLYVLAWLVYCHYNCLHIVWFLGQTIDNQ